MTSVLPTDAPEFTPEWFTEVLAPSHPGVRVAAVEVLGRSAATNLHLRLGLGYEDQVGAPDSVFVKLPPLDAAHREAIGATGMGTREARFYAEVAPLLKMRVPTSYFAASADDGSFVLVLEDLAARGCRISDGSWAVPGELAGPALEELAEMHVRFEDAAVRNEIAPWAGEQRMKATDFTTRMLRQVIDEHHDILSADYVAVGEIYIERHAELEALWDQGPQTLIHGDTHVGNLFIDDGRVGFLDWGLTTVSSPIRDVSYFLTVGCDSPDRWRSSASSCSSTSTCAAALGGARSRFDEAWLAHRVQAAYTVIATFLGLVPPYNVPEGRLFATAFRERSMAALEDLDTVAALREVLP